MHISYGIKQKKKSIIFKTIENGLFFPEKVEKLFFVVSLGAELQRSKAYAASRPSRFPCRPRCSYLSLYSPGKLLLSAG